ncbi:MAG TPA: hypothetical protein RMH26_13680, partial [Polyangiaceae bacterium LLY-WYZ-15_(1-7)]|nr:hypothetical protein [Polyangiaceae bacterium LLY-WYZ-15_(1-7)]
RLIPGLRLGLGVATLADIGGRLLVGLDGGNQFFSQTETQLLAGFHPIVGLHLDLPGDLTIGAVYRNKVQSDIDLAIRAENLLPGELELPVITITAIPQFDPHTVALEGAWRPTSDWLLSLQLQYQHWSTYPGVVGKTTSNSDLPPHPGFRNTITPRLGVEWEGQHRRTTAQLRGGYAFVPTPARPARLATKRDSEGEDLVRPSGDPVQQPLRYLDNHRHLMSLGGSIIWESSSGAHVQFDLFTQLHYLMPRTHDIPAEGTEGPGLETRGWILTAGWGVVFEW